jgi:MarR family 2-MHQ and catechol resistance regulon transcriptional repressor
VSVSLNDSRLVAIELFFEAYDSLTACLGEVLQRNHHLSLNEFTVLRNLAAQPHGRLRMSELAAGTSLSKSGVTRIIDRLERGEFVCRRPDRADQRVWYAEITGEGQVLFEAAVSDVLLFTQREVIARLPREQLAQMLAALRTIATPAGHE